MECIICRNDKERSQFNIEHIIPEAIKGNLKIYCVCIECNSKMGDNFDNELTDCWIIKTTMARLKIKDKNGNIPNLFSGINIHRKDGKKVSIISNKKGEITETTTSQIVQSHKDDKGLAISIVSSKKNIKDICETVNTIRRRNNMPILSDEEILKSANVSIEEISQFKMTCSIDTTKLELALLKISYELACYWLGSEYSSDKTSKMISKQIKDYIYEGKYNKDISFGIISLEKELIPEFVAWEDVPYKHIVCMVKYDERIICYIKIFDSLFARFLISEDIQNYTLFESMFISIDTKNGERIETTLKQEKDRFYRELIK